MNDFKIKGTIVSKSEIEFLSSIGKKWCPKCSSAKEYNQFGKDKHSKDNYTTKCRECSKKQCLSYYENNSDKIKKYKRDYYTENPEVIKDIKKRCYNKHITEYRKYGVDYRKNNHEMMLERDANYRKNNPEKIAASRDLYVSNNKRKVVESIMRYRKKRYNSDVVFKMHTITRGIIRRAFLYAGLKKDISTYKALGYTGAELKQHLEKLFKDGMSWENYGRNGWVIDHIVPISSAKTIEEGLHLSRLENLQPLWWKDNSIKGKKIIVEGDDLN